MNVITDKKFQLLIFDWDGTLVDSEACIIDAMQLASAEAELPKCNDAQIRDVIGLSLEGAIEALFPGAEKSVRNSVADRYREHYFSTSTSAVPVFEGVVEILEKLNQEDYFLAVATGKSRRGLDRSLSETGLDKYFHTTRCADEAVSKPAPQMLIEIIDFFGLEAVDTLMIGDSEYDLQMANNAGAESIAVSYGVHNAERLQQCEPLGIIHKITELSDYL
jgi:phosphoglycolate phosphatase